MKLKQLQERLAAHDKKMREFADKVEAEDRGFTPEERDQWKTLNKERDVIEERVGVAEKLETGADGFDEDLLNDDNERRFQQRKKSHSSRNQDPKRPLTPAEELRAFATWALGSHCDNAEDIELAQRAGYSMAQQTIELRFDRGFDVDGSPFQAPTNREECRYQAKARREFRNERAREMRSGQRMDSFEARAQSVGSTTGGGHTVPDEAMGPLEAAMLKFGGMRQVARIISTATGADMPIPTVNDTTNQGRWLGENASATQTDVVFGQLVLEAHKASSDMILTSIEMIQDSILAFASFLGSALGERLGRVTNAAWTVGDGTAKPHGVVPQSFDSGVTAAVAGELDYAEIVDLKHTVDPAYRDGAIFMMHDATLRKMKAMVDSQNRPIWLPSLIPGEPPTFDGDRYVLNQDMPSAAAGKGLLYGDFSKYLIREVMGIQIKRSDERFFENLQVAFLGVGRFDGDLLDAGTHPIKYLTLA